MWVYLWSTDVIGGWGWGGWVSYWWTVNCRLENLCADTKCCTLAFTPKFSGLHCVYVCLSNCYECSWRNCFNVAAGIDRCGCHIFNRIWVQQTCDKCFRSRISVDTVYLQKGCTYCIYVSAANCKAYWHAAACICLSNSWRKLF